MDLNPAQLDAVATLRGPLLVLAGAGTGKTRVVTFRMARLIRHGTAPDRILAVTFTRKAAGEMLQRTRNLLGKKVDGRPLIGTFHSVCIQVLRRHIEKLGYPKEFALYDRSDQENVARDALREARVSTASLRTGDLLALVSRWKSAGVTPQKAAMVAETDQEHLASAAYRRYQQALKGYGAVDFDDLLICTDELFTKFPDVRRVEAGRFDHVLIDEYQDTNQLQYRIVKQLAGGHRNLCVVGDDDQAIYGWRGAEVEHILRFQHDWPEAKVVRLVDNYRSTGPILRMANTLIAFNSKRHGKALIAARAGGDRPRILQLPDELQEARHVAGEIRIQVDAGKAQRRDFAILLRTNEQSRVFEQELRKAQLPYVLVGGTSFYDRREVRDLLAYVKALVNPRDEVSLLRIINTPPRGISRATATSLQETATKAGAMLWEILSRESVTKTLRPKTAVAVEAFRQLIERYREASSKVKPSVLLRQLIEEIGYEFEIQRNFDDPNERASRWQAVEDVVNSAAQYEQDAKEPNLAGFLDQVTLDDRDMGANKESKLRGDSVVLMTLHSAKGLEFPEVFLVGMEEGILPHHRSLGGDEAGLEEERRLCYVGMTRAQNKLTMTLPLKRLKWGKQRDTIPSRFLYEMTGQADNPNAIAARAGRVPSKGRVR